MSDFIFWGFKITADGDGSHEIKRCLLLGRKDMINLDSIFKSKDITLPTKVHLVKAMVFPVVMYIWDSLLAQRLKRLPAMWETWVQSLGREDPLEKEMATHSSILAWRIPWMEELGGLQSTGGKESDTTERLHFHFHYSCMDVRAGL